jgi:signal transduction histidine kinase/phage shock protein PspC (stress-responsive transcriptional regulator)
MQPMAIPAAQPLRRDPDRGMVAGVCAGLAERLGVDPLLLRVVFVVAAAASGVGLLVYALAWALIPAKTTGRAHVRRLRAGPGGARTTAGVALLTLSALLVLRQLGLWFSDAIVWPVVLASAGVALVWLTTSADAEPEHGEGATADAPGERRRATAGVYRGGFGVALIVGAALLFLYANGLLAGLGDLALTAVVVTIALALILAPFWWRLLRSLSAERAARIRSQERAEVAAHLHDSVLQTLALIQRRADDPRAVATLARQQERELRAWLQGTPPPGTQESLASALALVAAQVETEHGVAVELVTVGDAPVDESTSAVVAAAREALVNAAKFAGDEPISVYAEGAPERVHVFVRDRGPGFDPETLPPDRRGVRESIVGRMERHGGHAAVRPAPGRGTEVELTLERQP